MDAVLRFALGAAGVDQAVEMGDSLPCGELSIMLPNGPVEQQAEAIDRAQRLFFQRRMNGIEPLTMFVAQRSQPQMHAVKWLAMRWADQQPFGKRQQPIN